MIMFGTSSLNLLMKWTMLDPASFLKIKQVNKMVDIERGPREKYNASPKFSKNHSNAEL